MTAKAKCMKGWEILAEMTMRNTLKKLAPFEQLDQNN